jgi:heme exporter protein D
MNPWPFVVVSYVIFFLGLALDALLPNLRRRKLLDRLDSRWRREQTRTAQRGST